MHKTFLYTLAFFGMVFLVQNALVLAGLPFLRLFTPYLYTCISIFYFNYVMFAFWRARGVTLLFIPLAILSALLTISNFALVYQDFGIINSADQTIVHDAFTALYFSVVTFTTLGYGDFVPTANARLWASLQALFGYVQLGILVAAVVAIVLRKQS